MSIQIMQGDQYALLFAGTSGGEPLDMSRIDRIEFSIGQSLRKCWPDEVTQDEDGNFLFPLTQEETFRLRSNAFQSVQIRVKFKGEGEPTVVGTNVGEINVTSSISKVVL